MSISIKQISQQVSQMIKAKADLGLMLPKTPTEIEYKILIGWGFYELDGDVVTAFAAIYEWKKYFEIGAVVTHPDYYGKGLGYTVTKKALEVAKQAGDKPIIAIVNAQSTRIFEKLGFVSHKMPTDQKFWEPCKQVCVEFGRWPECNCHFMIFENAAKEGGEKDERSESHS